MRKLLTITLLAFLAATFIGASCHPKRPFKKPGPPPPKETQKPEKLEPQEERPTPADSAIEEEVIEPDELPLEEESEQPRPSSPTLAAAENMAKESLRLLRGGEVISAALTAERAIGLEPQCGYCYYALASIRAAQKMWNDAIPLATSALQYLSDERAAKAAYIRALAYYHTGDLDRAEADCKYALTIDPTLEPAKNLLEMIY